MWLCRGAVPFGGGEEENLADMLENHELRRWGEVPLTLGGLSTEPDREARLAPGEPLTGGDASLWPLI